MENIIRNKLKNYKRKPDDILLDKIKEQAKHQKYTSTSYKMWMIAASVIALLISIYLLNKNTEDKANVKSTNNLKNKTLYTKNTKINKVNNRKDIVIQDNAKVKQAVKIKKQAIKQTKNIIHKEDNIVENKKEYKPNWIVKDRIIHLCKNSIDIKELIDDNFVLISLSDNNCSDKFKIYKPNDSNIVYAEFVNLKDSVKQFIKLVFEKSIKSNIDIKFNNECSEKIEVDFITQKKYNYKWNDGYESTKNIRAEVSPGGYIVSVTDEYCEDTIHINVKSKSVSADFYHTELYSEVGTPIYFRINNKHNAQHYKWNFGDSTYSSDIAPNHIYNKSGIYNVKLIVYNNICSDTAEKTLDIKSEEVKLPNIFTPNGDGQNDLFYLNVTQLSNYEAIIFNKNGKVVFKTKDPNIAWDGKLSSGDDASQGVYYYVIKGNDKNGKKYQYKGFVQLNR